MHKKLEADLISLAHSILQMKNKGDVFALKEKAQEVYEKTSVLAFIEEYINTTPNATKTKEMLVSNVEKSFELKEEKQEEKVEETGTIVHQLEEKIEEVKAIQPEVEVEKEAEEKIIDTVEEKVEEKTAQVEEILEQPFDELEEILFDNKTSDSNIKNDMKDVGERKTPTLEEELQDTLPVDVMANLFEKAAPKSLNDKLQTNIQIGLNDRITFVKNLFGGSQEDFNRVISQLNTLKTEKEAKKFIIKMVKPDYNWAEHEDLEARFMEIIARKFA